MLVLLTASLACAQQLRFEEHTIATGLTGGYQVVPADVNHDGKIDLIALASGMKDLVWFENPGWERHVIASGFAHMINLAAADIDGDGIPEIVLASEFSMDASRSLGLVTLLRHNGDPRQPWTATEIDRLPTSHRLRWADIDRSGKKVVINAPLTGANARAPEYRDHVPLVYYRPGEWKRRTISDAEEGVVHGIYVTDWDADGRDEFLSAGFLGIHLYKFGSDGAWRRTEIAKGDPAPWPKSGSSDVAVGTLKNERFIAAIEPWHGNHVAVYVKHGAEWQRQVIDDGLLDGHTALTADLDGDGRDEIIAGFRGKPYGVYIYSSDGKNWNRQVLDQGGISAAACAVADLDADGRLDVACIGSATQNLKWYRNAGSR